jgi:uracil-DNA glycosylase family 4
VGDRERYLKQQAELGGAEVVISRKATELVTFAAPPEASPVVTVKEVPSLQDTGMIPAAKRPGPAPEATPAWKKGAPPIPGPGLEVHPPAALAELGSLAAVASVIKECRLCALCEGRTNTVPGEGALDAKFVVVGEGPGATEDELGRPFVGRAGELLDGILGSIGIARESAYILNIVKCRPPSNRKPLPDEMAACLPYLHRQLAILRPKVILAAGGTAATGLLQSKASLGQLRGQVHRYAGIPVIVTYHPAALLRNPNWKRPTWDDVRIARQLYDL